MSKIEEKMKAKFKLSEADVNDSSKSEAKVYEKKYYDQIDFLHNESMLRKVRPITSFDEVALGRQLSQFDAMREAILEYDGSLSQLGVLPKIALTSRAVA